MNMTALRFPTLFLSLLLAGQAMSAPVPEKSTGGFSLGKTRIIYNEKNADSSLVVLNTSNDVFLMQSWVSAYAPTGTAVKPGPVPFIVTPPLYRQEHGQSQVRIVHTGARGGDREQVYWMNVKAIPATTKKIENSVQFAFVQRIKLFYRPDGLAGSPDDAFRQVTFSREGKQMVAHNPTPYHITFNRLSVGGKEIKDASAQMVPPMGEARYDLPAGAAGDVTFKSVNDFGGLTPEVNVKF